MVAAHRTRDGGELFIVETTALEGAHGWRYSHGGRKGRGACIMHGGDSSGAMEADFETGWITCYTHGCRGRIAEHPDTRAGAAGGQRTYRLPTKPTAAPGRAKPSLPAPTAQQGLNAALAAAQARLAGSPGAGYLGERGFSLAIAQAHGLGWGTDKAMAGRVVFPLTGPDGTATSATGRAVAPDRNPKYWTLPAATYPKGWFNGAGVALARSRGWPLYLCEGPFDALALLAGGIPTAAAVLGVDVIRTDWLAGLPRLVVCFDGDEAGQTARAKLAFAAQAAGVTVELLPAGILGDCKDLGEYWAAHHALPPQLAAHWAEAESTPAEPEPTPAPAPAPHKPQPMLWGDALHACEWLDVRPKYDAYALSHTYLDAGPESLAGIEAELWEEVAALPAGSPLPDLIAIEVFAWKNAAYMARRRRDDDLPPAWDDPAQAELSQP